MQPQNPGVEALSKIIAAHGPCCGGKSVCGWVCLCECHNNPAPVPASAEPEARSEKTA